MMLEDFGKEDDCCSGNEMRMGDLVSSSLNSPNVHIKNPNFPPSKKHIRKQIPNNNHIFLT